MNKGIGFSRTIYLDWLDATVSVYLENVETSELREQLARTIQDTVHGVEAQRKTIDVLTAIWIRNEKTPSSFRQEAFKIYPTLSTREDRLWLHYGMTLLCYPIFRQSTAVIGQIGRSQDTVTRKLVKDRVAAIVGHLGVLDRSIERILASLTNWGVLIPEKDRSTYKIQIRSIPTSNLTMQTWLLACALQSHPADAIPFEDLLRLPEIFPFRFSIGLDYLRTDHKFNVQRQGGGVDMVRLR